MKLLLLVGILLVAFSVTPSAKGETTYTKVTEDNTVETAGEVIVQASEDITATKTYTLDEIDAQIASLQADKAAIDVEIAIWQAIRTDVAAEAAKAVLAK